jgi:hypothetical protein
VKFSIAREKTKKNGFLEEQITFTIMFMSICLEGFVEKICHHLNILFKLLIPESVIEQHTVEVLVDYDDRICGKTIIPFS